MLLHKHLVKWEMDHSVMVYTFFLNMYHTYDERTASLLKTYLDELIQNQPSGIREAFFKDLPTEFIMWIKGQGVLAVQSLTLEEQQWVEYAKRLNQLYDTLRGHLNRDYKGVLESGFRLIKAALKLKSPALKKAYDKSDSISMRSEGLSDRGLSY